MTTTFTFPQEHPRLVVTLLDKSRWLDQTERLLPSRASQRPSPATLFWRRTLQPRPHLPRRPLAMEAKQ